MSLMNLILEEIISEITADDAYTRFYSSIPRDDYNQIVGGQGNVDKLTQFLLNTYKSCQAPLDSIMKFKNKLQSTDNVARQRFKEAFSRGEVADFNDAWARVEFLEKNGTTSENSLSKDGFYVVGTIDGWRITATLSYSANHKNYGASNWCTASDNNGRNSGIGMFREYAVKPQAILFQLVSQNNSPIQAQVFAKDGGIGMVCDGEDRPINLNVIRPKETYDKIIQTITDTSLLNKLLTLQNQFAEKELQYYSELTRIKNLKIQKIVEPLKKKAVKMNDSEEKSFNERWRRFTESIPKDGYQNGKFLEELLRLSNASNYKMNCTKEDCPIYWEYGCSVVETQLTSSMSLFTIYKNNTFEAFVIDKSTNSIDEFKSVNPADYQVCYSIDDDVHHMVRWGAYVVKYENSNIPKVIDIINSPYKSGKISGGAVVSSSMGEWVRLYSDGAEKCTASINLGFPYNPRYTLSCPQFTIFAEGPYNGNYVAVVDNTNGKLMQLPTDEAMGTVETMKVFGQIAFKDNDNFKVFAIPQSVPDNNGIVFNVPNMLQPQDVAIHTSWGADKKHVILYRKGVYGGANAAHFETPSELLFDVNLNAIVCGFREQSGIVECFLPNGSSIEYNIYNKDYHLINKEADNLGLCDKAGNLIKE